MSLKTRYFGGWLHYFDSSTDETIRALCPVWFKDDFLGDPIESDHWTVRDTNGAGEAMIGDAPSGVYALALDATNEIQLAGVDWGNQRTLTLNQKLFFEARVRFTVLPTGSVVAVVGLCGDHNAAVNTVAESIWARLDGSGAITLESDDTVHEQSLIASGVTLVANQWTVVRIEIDDTAAIRFYIDGARVASATTFRMDQVAALALQPVIRIGKESAAASVGTLQVDFITVGQSRS
jgi:hypothetical protein